MTDTHQPNAEKLQEILDVSPFQRWLGLTLAEAENGRIVIVCPWREELVSNPHTNVVHGGILATLIDLTGLYAVLTTGTIVTATVDLRVDYHRPATPGKLSAEGTVIRVGSKVCSAETRITAEDGRLLASGRGVYLPAGGTPTP